MSLRLLLLVAALLAAALLIVLLTPGGMEDNPVRASEGPAARLPQDRAAAEIEGPPRAERTTLAEPRAEDLGHFDFEQGESQIWENATAGQKVVVRVHLSMAGDQPYSFKGQKVMARSWDADTDDTFLHETRADEEGIAVFEFPGFIHIDWVRYTPPPDSGMAFALAENHIDLSPGTLYEESLEVGPAAHLHGRVVREDGGPAQGIKLHVYVSGDPWADLEDWDPGGAFAETGPDGAFVFPNMPPGEWGLAIEPDGWLQISPDLLEPEQDRSIFELEAGDRVDAGVFRVAPLHRFQVRVLDPTGAPVPGARVALEPVAFQSPAIRIATPEVEEQSRLDRWLYGEEAPALPAPASASTSEWSFGTLSWRTEQDGVVEALAIPGAWNLIVWPELGWQHDEAEVLRRSLQVPCEDQEVVMPCTLGVVRGRVVDLEGQPVSRASVRVSRRRAQSVSSRTARSDSAGRFSLAGLPSTGEYRIRIDHRDHLTSEWDVQVRPGAEAREFRLRRASVLRIRALDPEGNPLPRLRFMLLSGSPDASAVALQPAEASWLEAAVSANRYRRTNRDGTLEFQKLLPGTYEIALAVPSGSSGRGYVGPASSTAQGAIARTWVLAVREEPHVLTVDSVPAAPPRRAAVVHEGRVSDARTSESVSGALVILRQGRSAYGTRTRTDGLFRQAVPGAAVGILVLHEGHLPLEIPSREYLESQPFHDLRLEPGGRDVVLHLRSLDGMALPDVEVAFTGLDGQAVHCLTGRTGPSRSWETAGFAQAGELRLGGVRPGPLLLHVAIEGYELGTAALDIAPGNAPEELTIHLDGTLEELRARVMRAVGEE